MTIENGDFVDEDAEEILDALVRFAESTFEDELSPDDIAAVRSFYRPVAEYMAIQQDSLAEVLDGAQLADATDESLSLLTATIGVQRQLAEEATTRLRFSRSNPTDTTYSIAEGELAQTDSSDPVRFETTEATSIEFIDGFEDNDITEYTGDTGDFSTVTSPVYDGSYALEIDSVDGSRIYDENTSISSGCKLHCRINLDNNAVGGIMFGGQDYDNQYRLVLNDNQERIRIEKNDGGTTTALNTSSPNLPSSEWMEAVIDWKDNGDITATVYDSSDSEIGTVTTNDEQFSSGWVGFYSGNNNGTKHFDNFTMSAASADAQAVDAGAAGNVGADTLVVMPDRPTGIENVTNPQGATGGRNHEADDNLRSRAQSELSEGTRGTQVALINKLSKIDSTRNVTVIANDSDSSDAAGRPSHSFEAVVEQPTATREETANTIVETKAAGDTSVGGYAGTSVSIDVTLSNGQTKTITFSEPTEIKIYIDCDLSYEDDYPGNDEVQDSIVRYIGGVLNSGANERGDLGAGEDVIYNGVLDAIMDVPGVYDVTNLEVGTSSGPTGTSNIAIASTEVATSDATDASLDISSTQA